MVLKKLSVKVSGFQEELVYTPAISYTFSFYHFVIRRLSFSFIKCGQAIEHKRTEIFGA